MAKRKKPNRPLTYRTSLRVPDCCHERQSHKWGMIAIFDKEGNIHRAASVFEIVRDDVSPSVERFPPSGLNIGKLHALVIGLEAITVLNMNVKSWHRR